MASGRIVAGVRLVTKNTFVEVEDPHEGHDAAAPSKRSASCPPIAIDRCAASPLVEREQQEKQDAPSCDEACNTQPGAGDSARAPPADQDTPPSDESPFTAPEDADGLDGDATEEPEFEFVAMIKNISSRISGDEIKSVIERMGFPRDKWRLHVPLTRHKGGKLLNRGYAFVYFEDGALCERFAEVATGHIFEGHRSDKTLHVSFSMEARRR